MNNTGKAPIESTAVKILKELSVDVDVKDLLSQADLADQTQFRTIVGETIYKEMVKCGRGNPGNTNLYPKLFEKLCLYLIELTFESDFPAVKPAFQPKKDSWFGETTDIRDITLENRYKDITAGVLWNELKQDSELRCKTIVFECKNYDCPKSKVSSDEILQLYAYLNPDNHGKFGVILCRGVKDGIDESGTQAIFRVKQDGYVILLIGEEEIREWLTDWETNGTVEGFFSRLYGKYKVNTSENAKIDRVYVKKN